MIATYLPLTLICIFLHDVEKDEYRTGVEMKIDRGRLFYDEGK